MNEDTKQTKTYAFYIYTTADHSLVEWRGLTRAQAVQMNKLTDKRPPVGVTEWGWIEEF